MGIFITFLVNGKLKDDLRTSQRLVNSLTLRLLCRSRSRSRCCFYSCFGLLTEPKKSSCRFHTDTLLLGRAHHKVLASPVARCHLVAWPQFLRQCWSFLPMSLCAGLKMRHTRPLQPGLSCGSLGRSLDPQPTQETSTTHAPHVPGPSGEQEHIAHKILYNMGTSRGGGRRIRQPKRTANAHPQTPLEKE